MQNIFLELLANANVGINNTQYTVTHQGRVKNINLVSSLILGQGRKGSDVVLIEKAIPAYNELLISAAKAELAAEAKAELAAEAEKDAAVASQISALEAEKQTLINEFEEREAERKKPYLVATFYFASIMMALVAITLIGLNYYNANFFIGHSVGRFFVAVFALLFGASFIYFALSRNSAALKTVIWIIPFDLVIATLVKPFFGLDFEVSQIVSLESGALLLFLGVYCTQLYHIGMAVTRLFNPKDLVGAEEQRHLEAVKNSVI